MIPVSAAVRLELRRLKNNFDDAFARLSKDACSDDPDYRAAREAYGLWRVAIDTFGIPLIDSLDAAEEKGSAAARFGLAPAMGSAVEPMTEDQKVALRIAFQDIDHMSEMVRLIDDE